jgi:5'(3')-deoxyribonucleotidase
MKNDKTTFVVDLDGVLRDIFSQMIKLYNNEFGENLKSEDVKNYDVEVSFPKAHAAYGSSYHYFFEKHADYVFLLSPPMEGAVEAIKRLKEYGKIVIATIQPTTHNKILALKWLDKWGVPYDEIRFVDTKAGVKCDYFIEDYPKNMEGADGLKILIDAPYNQGVDEVNGWYIYRFESLESFVSWCEENLETWKPLSPVDEKIAELENARYELCCGCCVDSIEDCYECWQFEKRHEINDEIRKLENSKNK